MDLSTTKVLTKKATERYKPLKFSYAATGYTLTVLV